MITVLPHPLLDLRAFITRFSRPLGDMCSPETLLAFLAGDASAPLNTDDQIKESVRRLLRHGGFKPSGRSKPASEYLVGAASTGRLASINLAVDACNAVSLHSGLPISVVDLDRATPPLRVDIPAGKISYVFNASGQEIDVTGLLCLFDAEGPCANAVKDAQRTKTNASTQSTLSLLWGTNELPGRVDEALVWYQRLLGEAGAATETLVL